MGFAEYQNERYQHGQTGRQPPYPIVFADLEAKAGAAMPPSTPSRSTAKRSSAGDCCPAWGRPDRA
ncbi:lactate 2-monooxygenase domain protein [Mycobacterium xenopi 4042]|uniref:Lactate 2-monooxygenase domain protein n=1 Tax=Mycobacterium xenopi 4042 TaxID=1299334 RepID=X7ZX01_MYCXE|nr:lactate 2-monooxygenase domain protein [Mycobacterium xenopi 4042]